MLFFLLYAAVRRMLRALVGRSPQRSLEIENAVRRHQLAVLRRGVKRPRLRRLDQDPGDDGIGRMRSGRGQLEPKDEFMFPPA